MSLDEVRSRAKQMASAFGSWSVRPVLHVEGTTPFPTFLRVLGMLREVGFFTVTLSCHRDGEDLVLDLPDHVCPHLGGPDLRVGASNHGYWVQSPTNVVDVSTLRKRIAAIRQAGHSHLHLVVNFDEANTDGLVDLATVLRESGFSEATLAVQ